MRECEMQTGPSQHFIAVSLIRSKVILRHRGSCLVSGLTVYTTGTFHRREEFEQSVIDLCQRVLIFADSS
jgi:hypothetical protein